MAARPLSTITWSSTHSTRMRGSDGIAMSPCSTPRNYRFQFRSAGQTTSDDEGPPDPLRALVHSHQPPPRPVCRYGTVETASVVGYAKSNGITLVVHLDSNVPSLAVPDSISDGFLCNSQQLLFHF